MLVSCPNKLFHVCVTPKKLCDARVMHVSCPGSCVKQVSCTCHAPKKLFHVCVTPRKLCETRVMHVSCHKKLFHICVTPKKLRDASVMHVSCPQEAVSCMCHAQNAVCNTC